MRQIVEPDAHVMTDGGTSFVGLAEESKGADGKPCPPVVAAHDTVTHKQKEFVRGIVHANTAEAFNDRIRRAVVGVFHHVSPKHVESYFDEAAFRASQRVCIGYANRRTRKGKIVSRPDWRRVHPSSQMANLMAGAVGRQLRSTPEGGLRVLSRIGIVSRAPKSVTMDLSDVDVINF